MSSTTAAMRHPRRTVVRVSRKQRLGPGPQVDDHALVIAPNPALTDPFLVLMEDWMSDPGFDWHPHRGLETVTTVLDGVLEHGDSLGNAGALHPGDTQWMTAGRGIIHRELAYRNEGAHTLQLWVNLPRAAKLTDMHYQNLLASGRPHVTLPGVDLDVVAGHVHGVTAPTILQWPLRGAVVTIDPETSFDYELPADHRAFVFAVDGGVTANGVVIDEGCTGWSDPLPDAPTGASTRLTLSTEGGARRTRLIIFSGPPMNEPVVLGGPFVMNSAAEIEQAFADFRAGRFGEVPRQARLRYDR